MSSDSSTGYKRSGSPLKSSLKLKSDVLYTLLSVTLDPNVLFLKSLTEIAPLDPILVSSVNSDE